MDGRAGTCGETVKHQGMIMRTESDAPAPLRIVAVGKDEWIRYSQSFSDYNFRHVWDYGEALARRRKSSCEHVAIFDGEELLGIADVRIKRLPIISGGLAYISGGPLTMRDGVLDAGCLEPCLRALAQEYAQARGYVLRIAPSIGTPDRNAAVARCFDSVGFEGSKKARIYRTFLLDIGREEDAIRKSLAQKWRNCLNAAEKAGIEMKVGTEDSMFGEFAEVLRRLIDKKGFSVDLDADFYRSVQSSASPQDKLYVFLAYSMGEIHAGGVFSMHGDTCTYLLGATSEQGLKTKASYYLHWQVIKQAREKGMRYYDLGGIDPVANPGVFAFKKGFGGEDVTAAGPYEISRGGLGTLLVKTAEAMLKR